LLICHSPGRLGGFVAFQQPAHLSDLDRLGEGDLADTRSPITLELDQPVGGQFLERIPHDKSGRVEVLTELALHESLPRRIITPDDGGT
jgi:hypothetical protein